MTLVNQHHTKVSQQDQARVRRMRTRELDWRKFPVPETPQQKINYSNVCQNFFVDAMAQPIIPSTSLIEVEGGGTIEPPRFLTTNDMISLPQNMTFRCAVCGQTNAQGHAAALVMANPYSRWAILQCRACSET